MLSNSSDVLGRLVGIGRIVALGLEVVVVGGEMVDLLHEPVCLVFLLFDGILELEDFGLELPDLQLGLKLGLLNALDFLFLVVPNLLPMICTCFSFFISSVWRRDSYFISSSSSLYRVEFLI